MAPAATPEAVWAIIADVDISGPTGGRRAAPRTGTQPKINSQEDVLKATTAHLNFKAALGCHHNDSFGIVLP